MSRRILIPTGRNAALTHRLGSQTSTVLAHGPIPVLVVPLRRQEA